MSDNFNSESVVSLKLFGRIIWHLFLERELIFANRCMKVTDYKNISWNCYADSHHEENSHRTRTSAKYVLILSVIYTEDPRRARHSLRQRNVLVSKIRQDSCSCGETLQIKHYRGGRCYEERLWCDTACNRGRDLVWRVRQVDGGTGWGEGKSPHVETQVGESIQWILHCPSVSLQGPGKARKGNGKPLKESKNRCSWLITFSLWKDPLGCSKGHGVPDGGEDEEKWRDIKAQVNRPRCGLAMWRGRGGRSERPHGFRLPCDGVTHRTGWQRRWGLGRRETEGTGCSERESSEVLKAVDGLRQWVVILHMTKGFTDLRLTRGSDGRRGGLWVGREQVETVPADPSSHNRLTVEGKRAGAGGCWGGGVNGEGYF